MLTKSLGWLFGVLLLVAAATIWVFLRTAQAPTPVQQSPTPAQQSPRSLEVEFPGEVVRLILDSGQLTSSTDTKKLLYQLSIEYPNPEATLFSLLLKGTELGEGSFIRLRYPHSTGQHSEQIVNAQELARWRGFIHLGGDVRNSVVVELWGGAKTQNRLRIEEIGVLFYGRPKFYGRTKYGS